MLASKLLSRFIADPERNAMARGQTAPLRQIQAVYQLLSRNLEFEQKYLERLEGMLPALRSVQFLNKACRS